MRIYDDYIEPSKRAITEGFKKLPHIPPVPMPTLPSKETIVANVDSLKKNLADKGTLIKNGIWGMGGYLQKKIWGSEEKKPGLQEKEELQLPGTPQHAEHL